MNIDKILKDQDAWLKKVPSTFKLGKVKVEDTKRLKGAIEQRIAALDQRIGRLSTAREAAIKRYDDAIAAEKSEVERLRKELKKVPAIER